MTNVNSSPRPEGSRKAVAVALGAALLFGVSTPAASVLARTLSPLWLSGALYLGVAFVLVFARAERRPLARRDFPWLLASALVGGVVAPVCLVTGLRTTDAASASLLLAVETPATALIAWLVVREHAARRTVIGMAAIALGAAILAWRGSPGASLGSLAIAGAALCWGIDNNLQQRIASSNAIAIAGLKGLVAGCVSCMLALALHEPIPAPAPFTFGIIVGLVGYGCSLIGFLRALRTLGTARAAAYLATAPFAGAVAGLALGGTTDFPRLAIAGALMACGVYLHATERHEHAHEHPAVEHTHWHAHDEHHAHAHAHDEIRAHGQADGGVPSNVAHEHRHAHPNLVHVHAHTPDAEHRHDHTLP
jgi:drug/metabolite transporter (DMT)-like permease